MKFGRLTVIAMLSAFLSINSWSQTATTSLKGKVADSQGGMISAAKVTLSDDSKNYSRSTATDDLGFYQFVQVPPGIYELSVKAAGFSVERQRGLQLLVNLPATSNIVMQVEGAKSTIEVSANAAQLNTEDATLGTAFNSSQGTVNATVGTGTFSTLR